MKKRILDVLMLVIGAFFFALAVNLFAIPNDLGEGGVTGITLILYYVFEWSPGITNFILNAFLLLIGYKFLDGKTTVYTIIAVAANSLFLHLTHGWSTPSDELIINTIFAGVFAGIGIGMIIRVGGTTAGSAILARIANKYLDWNISYALLFFDLIVVFSSYFIIGAEKMMFTIVMLYIGTKVMDFIIEGLNTKKAITVISEHKSEISEQVNTLMDRGVTILSGKGSYTGQSKEILYIVINKQELSMLKKIIRSCDKKAFVIVHDVRDVFGEGFVDISK
ncbi:YitT family protein [Bacillus vallismortis]|uniref:YitT family protein n=1 Tax=Bacillus vallismortis TaxID=72361 RepID=A0AAP3FVM9_BACVA|nr:YitT family protein [Bacillus vallismortis]MBG9770769.1 membrane protein [Bacillus vallismortis]MCI3983418.1 YitT family protein [Bacillus vallismortis]MCI4137499.1 YitT family protein [Bacillus vallismortis]MCO4852574.1 YitT family protein [Bacillus vallismortis]MCY7892775.1 YitT family protein [Bacillus vallismortis]